MTHLESVPTPGKMCGQEISVRDDKKCQKDSQRKQPDERPPSAISAVAVVTGWANQRDKQEAKNWTNTCGYKHRYSAISRQYTNRKCTEDVKMVRRYWKKYEKKLIQSKTEWGKTFHKTVFRSDTISISFFLTCKNMRTYTIYGFVCKMQI